MRALSNEQVFGDEGLADFIKRFSHLFYLDPIIGFYFYYPEGVPENLTAKFRPENEFDKQIDLDANKN